MKVILAIGLLAVLVMGTYLFMTRENRVNIHGQTLEKYSSGSGGGMNGGHRSFTASIYDEENCLITTSGADWYFEDPEIHEYLVSRDILKEIEAVVRKYKMNNWKNKKFTNMFVADGDTTSYDFDFTDDSVWFSSQIYPQRYRRKLEELKKIENKYLENAVELPKLVLSVSQDMEWGPKKPEKGEISIGVYQYSEERLYVRANNGTEDVVSFSESYELIKCETGEVLAAKQSEYEREVYPDTCEDFLSVKVDKHLEPGLYELKTGELNTVFEIR